MVPPHRRALRARLLLLRYIDGLNSIEPPGDVCRQLDKVMAGGTPANPAALAPRRRTTPVRSGFALRLGGDPAADPVARGVARVLVEVPLVVVLRRPEMRSGGYLRHDRLVEKWRGCR